MDKPGNDRTLRKLAAAILCGILFLAYGAMAGLTGWGINVLGGALLFATMAGTWRLVAGEWFTIADEL